MDFSDSLATVEAAVDAKLNQQPAGANNPRTIQSKIMKLEKLCFTITISAHDKNGQRVRIVVTELAKRTQLVESLNSVGVSLKYNSPYKMIKEKSYPVDPQAAECFLGVRFGEFIYEPHINIIRNTI